MEHVKTLKKFINESVNKIDKYFLWGSNKISLVLLKKIGSPAINKEYSKKSLGLFLKKELSN